MNVAQMFATVGRVGFTPVAPGTAGSLVPCLVVFLLQKGSLLRTLPFTPLLILILLSLPSIHFVLKNPLPTCSTPRKKADPSYIVMDEVVGQLLTLWLVQWAAPLTGRKILLAFIAFRFFDIVKPWPIRNVEAALSKQPSLQAFGVVADDLLAGVFAGLLIVLAIYVAPFVSFLSFCLT